MTAFQQTVNDRFQANLRDYAALHCWSIDAPEQFWRSVCDFCGVRGEAGNTVLDDAGNINEDARQCLELIAKHDMILATGHLGRHEIFPLVKEAKARGVQRIIVTHAEFPSQNLTGAEQAELADLGAVIEHCFTTYHTNKAPWEAVFANIRTTGVERSMLATDLGQKTNPPVAEGFAMFAQKMLDAGYTVAEVHLMAATIPAGLIH